MHSVAYLTFHWRKNAHTKDYHGELLYEVLYFSEWVITKESIILVMHRKNYM